MANKVMLLVLFFSLSFNHSQAQSIDKLRQKINEVLVNKDATVGVAIAGLNPSDTLSVNGDKHLPMQSVFKYHLAVAILNQVDKGNFDLERKVSITKEDVNNKLWSPIREKYPKGIDLTLAEILEYTVSYSDNVGCDVLLRLLGGVKILESYLHKMGITDIAVKHNEKVQQSAWKYQYENWTTAKATNMALKIFFENTNEQLSTESYDFLWTIMKGTKTGKKCIKGSLPKDTIVAHKTGSSGKNDSGLTGARNDIGIIFLPNGTYFYLSVLVTDSSEENDVNKKIIADIAKLSWDYFESKK